MILKRLLRVVIREIRMFIFRQLRLLTYFTVFLLILWVLFEISKLVLFCANPLNLFHLYIRYEGSVSQRCSFNPLFNSDMIFVLVSGLNLNPKLCLDVAFSVAVVYATCLDSRRNTCWW